MRSVDLMSVHSEDGRVALRDLNDRRADPRGLTTTLLTWLEVAPAV